MTEPAPRFRLLRAAWPWLAAMLSGLLLVLCYPPFHQGWLVWVALTPLLSALWRNDAPRRGWRNFLLGYVTGAVFFPATFYWIGTLSTLFESPGLRVLPALLGLYLAVYFGFWSWFLGSVLRRGSYRFDSSPRNLALGALAACAWVSHEWVRGWLFSGFGWNGLAVALRGELPMIQIADLTGELGLAWMIAFANTMAVIIVKRIAGEIGPLFTKRIRWEFSATMLVLSAAMTYGVHSLLAPRPAGTVSLKVAVLQPNIPEEVKKFAGPEGEERMLGELAELNGYAAAMAPDLIVWPESAVPRGAFADQESHAFVAAQMAHGDYGLLTGSLDYDLSPDPEKGELVFNAAMLFTEHGARHETYRKIHLVPYGEYLPLRPIMPAAIAALIPGDFAFGEKATVLSLPKPALQVGALICFEDSVSSVATALVRNGADLLVNITNDAWFRETPGSEQHLANATLRAVETRRPLVRCTNSGMTCAIDPQGRVDRWIRPFTHSLAVREVTVARGAPLTFYTRHGDWCAYLAVALTALAGVRAGLRRRHSSLQ